jgi:hypothetical protein
LWGGEEVSHRGIEKLRGPERRGERKGETGIEISGDGKRWGGQKEKEK